jgi:hypothetical protein
MADKVDISGLDRLELLHRLWERSSPALFFSLESLDPPKWDEKTAAEALERNRIDYLMGRAIKCRFDETNQVDPRLYDRDNGQGAFKKVVDGMR